MAKLELVLDPDVMCEDVVTLLTDAKELLAQSGAQIEEGEKLMPWISIGPGNRTMTHILKNGIKIVLVENSLDHLNNGKSPCILYIYFPKGKGIDIDIPKEIDGKTQKQYGKNYETIMITNYQTGTNDFDTVDVRHKAGYAIAAVHGMNTSKEKMFPPWGFQAKASERNSMDGELSNAVRMQFLIAAQEVIASGFLSLIG